MRFLLFLLFLPALAVAQDRIVEPSQVIAVLNDDLDDDGILDRAVLYYYSDWDFADLSVYHGTVQGYLEEAAYSPKIAWNGHGQGVTPYLTRNEAGSLQVMSGNESVGPSRWHETVTIAFRGGRFVVAGYTFETYELNDPDLGGLCDTNYLSGRGVLTPNSGKAENFRVPKGGIPLEEWSPADVPPQCAAG